MDDILRQVVRFQNTVRDQLDDPQHPQAQELSRRVQDLVNAVKGKQNARSLENRVQDIDRLLDKFDEKAMDYKHSDELRDSCEELRQQLRKLQ